VSDTTTAAQATEAGEARRDAARVAPPGAGPGAGRAALKKLTTPAVLALVLLGLWAWVSSQELDSIEQRSLNLSRISQRVVEHVWLVSVSTVLVLVIAIPLGVLLSRRWARPATPLVLGLGNIGQATPAIGLLVLATLWFGVGKGVATAGLVVYALLPVLRNTLVGIQQVDQTLVQAGRAMGMTAWDVLLRIEMRLATPVIMAGVRTALVLNVGVATLAVFVNAGGLGDFIVTGIKLDRWPVLVVGSVLTTVLALLIDWLGGLFEDVAKPRGLKDV
jgi:osmoprotectant transport system permease protein